MYKSLETAVLLVLLCIFSIGFLKFPPMQKRYSYSKITQYLIVSCRSFFSVVCLMIVMLLLERLILGHKESYLTEQYLVYISPFLDAILISFVVLGLNALLPKRIGFAIAFGVAFVVAIACGLLMSVCPWMANPNNLFITALGLGLGYAGTKLMHHKIALHHGGVKC